VLQRLRAVRRPAGAWKPCSATPKSVRASRDAEGPRPGSSRSYRRGLD
jgi:hypothetical protein